MQMSFSIAWDCVKPQLKMCFVRDSPTLCFLICWQRQGLVLEGEGAAGLLATSCPSCLPLKEGRKFGRRCGYLGRHGFRAIWLTAAAPWSFPTGIVHSQSLERRRKPCSPHLNCFNAFIFLFLNLQSEIQSCKY